MMLSMKVRKSELVRVHWTRTDVYVQEQLQQLFRATPYRELGRTSCRFKHGIVTLNGEVTSFYLKQIAQTLVKRVRGVRRILNHINVRPPPESNSNAQP